MFIKQQTRFIRELVGKIIITEISKVIRAAQSNILAFHCYVRKKWVGNGFQTCQNTDTCIY